MGLAMGIAGTEVAKAAADIVIMVSIAWATTIQQLVCSMSGDVSMCCQQVMSCYTPHHAVLLLVAIRFGPVIWVPLQLFVLCFSAPHYA